MNTLQRTFNYTLFFIFGLFLLCTSACKSTGDDNTDTLYFEPPKRLIDDYSGMFQTDEVNWAWTQIGFSFSNYKTLSLQPVHLFIEASDKGLAHKLDQGLLAWFEDTGIILSDSAAIVCEVAIVEAKLERGFLSKLKLFAEDKRDFLLEVEVVIKETATNTTICKMRHGAIAAEVALLQERVLGGITSYFSAYK